MQNRNDHAISKALEAWGGSFDRIGPGQWGLALPGAQNRTFSARLEGSWLVIEEPPNAEGECMAVEQVDMWNYLGRNAGLAGNAKFTICEDGSIQVRAEIPLEGIPSEVHGIEPLGRDNLIDVKIGDIHFYLLADPSISLKSGDTVKLGFNTNKSQFFDMKTEQSLLWN